VNKRKTPPGANPAARSEQGWVILGFDGVAALPVLALGGRDRQAHLFADRAREESTQRVGLPGSRLYQFPGRCAAGRFSISRIVSVLLPSRATPFSLAAFPARAPRAFFAPLGAFLAGLAFFPDLGLDDATLRARLATWAFFAAFGWSLAAVAWAVSVSSAVVIMFSPLTVITVTTSITPKRPESKGNRDRNGTGDGTAMAGTPASWS